MSERVKTVSPEARVRINSILIHPKFYLFFFFKILSTYFRGQGSMHEWEKGERERIFKKTFYPA